mgnify:CR=1 FL=1
MRKKLSNEQLSLHLIAGTRTVLIAIDVAANKIQGLLGFAIKRIDLSTQKEV